MSYPLVHGSDCIVSLRDATSAEASFQPLVCQTNFTLKDTTELVAATSYTSGSARQYKPRLSDWSLTVNGITTIEGDWNVIRTLIESVRRTLVGVEILFMDESGATSTFYGGGYIYETTINGDVGAFSDFTIEIQGSGGYALNDIPLINTSDVQPFEYIATGGETFFSDPVLISRTPLLVLRESTPATEIILSGTPTGKKVKYTGASGRIDFPADSPLMPGEIVNVLYK